MVSDQKNRFWAMLTEKLVLVDYGRKNWFGAILTEKTCFGRFWPEKVVLNQFSYVVAQLSTNWA